jgi:hypothetical protein
MKIRRVYSAADITVAQRAISAARMAGVNDDNISLIARSDIEMQSIPNDRIDASTDFMPAALRGAGVGGAIGLVAGIVAIAIPPIGITVAGVGLITLVSAAVAGWSAALMGSALPNSVRRTFEKEIEDGRILVVIDKDDANTANMDRAMEEAGANTLPFEEPTVLA